MRIILFCLVVLLVLPCGVRAQKTGLLSGRVMYEEKASDGPFKMWHPLVGATAQLVTSSRDTLLLITDRDGVFTFKQIPQGQAFLQTSFVGYKTRVDTVQVERNTILRFLTLAEEARKIDEVVVKGKIPLVNRVGDTLVYNAAAMPTLAGDDAVRIVEQMPGAEVSSSGVKIQGESVARSYVNGKLLFGDDAMSVLNNLLASEVAKIKVYEETTDEDRRAGYPNGRKQKVIDVVTKKPIVSAATGHFLASMGSNFDRGGDGDRRLRYGAGVTSNFFSEKLLVGVNAFGNNIGRRSNRLSEILNSNGNTNSYNEDIFANVTIERFWGDRRDGSSVRGGYTYTDNASETRSISRRSYFQTESNPAMQYNDTTSSDSRRYSHEAFVDVDLHGHKSKFLSGFRLTNKFTYNTNEGNSLNSMNIMTEKGVDYSNTRNRNNTDGYTIDESVSWTRYGGKRLPSFRFHALISDNTDSGWRVDTLSSTGSRRVLESNGASFSQQYDWRVSMPLLKPPKFVPGQKGRPKFTQLSLTYSGAYEDSRKRKLALNLDDEQNPVDVTNTMDYTYNYLTHTIETIFGKGFGKDWTFFTIAGVEYKTPQKNDRFPEDYSYSKKFVMPTGNIMLQQSNNGKYVMFSLSVRGSAPSIEQITARINDANPLQLSAGNPNLKATQNYNLMTRWSKTFDLTGKAVEVSLTAGYVRNAVTTRARFFAEPTQLPEWENYTTQANATLSTFENVDGNANANFGTSYSFRFGRWMSVRTGISGSYDRNRFYVGDALSTTDTYAPSVTLNMQGTLAQKFRYGIFTSTRYSYSENTFRDSSRNLGWNCTVTVNYDLLKWLFAQVLYAYSAQRFYTQTGTDRNTHTLNAVVGFKAYKDMLTLSVSAFDVLNKGTSFSSSMQSNYVLDTWTPSFGRYWLVNVGVKFNRNKGGKTYKGRMGDGSVHGGGMFNPGVTIMY